MGWLLITCPNSLRDPADHAGQLPNSTPLSAGWGRIGGPQGQHPPAGLKPVGTFGERVQISEADEETLNTDAMSVKLCHNTVMMLQLQ